LDGIAKLQAQGLDLLKTHDAAGRTTYQIVRKKQDYEFCFDAALARGPTQLSEAMVNSRRCGKPIRGASSSASYSLEISTRSTEGIIYFLGEIARGELNLTGEKLFVPTLRFDKEEDTLFALRRGRADESLSVAYEGVDYTVVTDPSARDHSSQVLDLVQQLLALNSSAKDLPAPNIITVIGR
jgi:hypothetical protein